MRKNDAVASVIIVIILVAIFSYAYSRNKRSMGTVSGAPLEQRLAECGSLPNGSVNRVVETSRVFVNIPKDYYPNVQLQIDQEGAEAGYVSNGGQYGYALDANGKPDCWSYYFEFSGNGTVDITSKSGVSSAPPYHIRFVVSTTTSQ